ncbi:MAG: aldose 1-epimerase [Bacteroidales bacterium]|jgi:aldose 1-epimerase
MNSRFYITGEKFGPYSLYHLKDDKTGEYVSVIPELGGAINDLVLRQEGRLVHVIDGYKNYAEAEKNLLSSFKGSNLFPFPNRLEGGKYNYKGQIFEIDCNFPQENNAIHGFVFDKPFDIILKEDGDIGCAMVIRYISTEKVPGYPFENMIDIDYRWNEVNQFTCTTKISNLSDGSMPVGHGWHPYFIAGDAPVDELYIQFPSKEVLEVNDKGIPTGISKEYRKFNALSLLKDTKLDNCFLLNTENELAEIIVENKKDKIRYKVWQQTGINRYNYLQVYTPPTRNAIAFEPMTCAPNAFNNEKGLIVLAPQERISLLWGISSLE